jgi:hypothetical protein
MGGLSTKSSNVSDKKTKIANLMEKHTPLFASEGVEKGKVKFIPKMAYIPAAGAERVIAFFPSEMSGNQDIYTEFVSKDYDPEDPERRLWKWSYNPHYEAEYETTQPHPVSGHCRYLIPVDELIDVAEAHQNGAASPAVEEEKSTMNFDDLPDPDEDQPIASLTIRDKAAIDWKLPVSKKKWLNELITTNFK